MPNIPYPYGQLADGGTASSNDEVLLAFTVLGLWKWNRVCLGDDAGNRGDRACPTSA